MDVDEAKRFMAQHQEMTKKYDDLAMDIVDNLIEVLDRNGKINEIDGRFPLTLNVDNPPEYVQSISLNHRKDDVIITVYGVREEGVEFSLKNEVSYCLIVPVVSEIIWRVCESTGAIL